MQIALEAKKLGLMESAQNRQFSTEDEQKSYNKELRDLDLASKKLAFEQLRDQAPGEARNTFLRNAMMEAQLEQLQAQTLQAKSLHSQGKHLEALSSSLGIVERIWPVLQDVNRPGSPFETAFGFEEKQRLIALFAESMRRVQDSMAKLGISEDQE